MNALDSIIDKLTQESTWRGIVALLMAVGVTLEPGRMDAIVAAGMTIIGLINVIKNPPKSAP